ncbi:hypothetical protein DSO57_1011073 [Entomophthora muscae]|uniref:Uncharacterized protein n=1 Tax=Entomophthora muscae TaxID=34485 RepID=A0ACC2TTX9_9FUNG|nr:hypothetical protein DSO57_1011073 [Entomophthora muscae]
MSKALRQYLHIQDWCPHTSAPRRHHPGKRLSEVEMGLSHSTMDTHTKVPSVPPNFPIEELEDNAEPPTGAKHSPYRAKLFVPD